MLIYVTHSTSFYYKTDLYLPLKGSRLTLQHQIVLPHDTSEAPYATQNFLKTCDIILAEVSHPSTGQGIELGIASTLHIPIVCFFKNTAKPSSSLSTITTNIYPYTNSTDMIDVIVNQLSVLSGT